MRSVTDFDDQAPRDLAKPVPGDLGFTHPKYAPLLVEDGFASHSNLTSPMERSRGEEIPTEIDPFQDLHPELLRHWEDALRTGYGETPETIFLFPRGQFVVVLREKVLEPWPAAQPYTALEKVTGDGCGELEARDALQFLAYHRHRSDSRRGIQSGSLGLTSQGRERIR